jgi:hypothetical protein
MWHVAGLAFLACVCGGARAEFLRDYRGWERLSALGQQGYVAGVLDQNGVANALDDRQLMIRSAAELCLGHSGNTSKAIARDVTDAYRREPKLSKQPPFLVTWYVAARRCKTEINDELARSGLEPLNVDAILAALKVDVARAR